MQKGENLCAPNLADNPGSRVQKDILLGGSSTFVLDLTHSGLLSLLTTLVNLAGMGMGCGLGGACVGASLVVRSFFLWDLRHHHLQ